MHCFVYSCGFRWTARVIVNTFRSCSISFQTTVKPHWKCRKSNQLARRNSLKVAVKITLAIRVYSRRIDNCKIHCTSYVKCRVNNSSNSTSYVACQHASVKSVFLYQILLRSPIRKAMYFDGKKISVKQPAYTGWAKKNCAKFILQ